jgi:hypothetical protein
LDRIRFGQFRFPACPQIVKQPGPRLSGESSVR